MVNLLKIGLLSIVLLLIPITRLYAQTSTGMIGAFEFDGEIYVCYQDKLTDRFLSKKVEGYLSSDVLATTLKNPVDVIYHSKHGKIYAIYQTNNLKFMAHAIHDKLDNSPAKTQVTFGVVKDPNANRTMAVYLNNQNRIISFYLD